MSMKKKEAKRYHLRQEAARSMDEEAAEELMDSLPPLDWTDLATKADVATMQERTDSSLGQLRQEVLSNTAGLATLARGQEQINANVGAVREQAAGLGGRVTGLEGEVGGLRQEVGGLRQEVGGLRQDFAALHSDLRDWGLKLMFGCCTAIVGVGALVLAASRVAP